MCTFEIWKKIQIAILQFLKLVMNELVLKCELKVVAIPALFLFFLFCNNKMIAIISEFIIMENFRQAN